VLGFNLLLAPLVRIVPRAGGEQRLTLPGTMLALLRDEVATFPALRAHQRHAWHAFLCQLAALALARAGCAEPWTDEANWREALRGLTPDHPDDAPWSLVAPPDRPALLQPPLPDGLAALGKTVATPDALDMLVTSRNHDLKTAVMGAAAADDWLFALVTLQTMEGFLGAGNYGISRMNGGFASRPALGLAPPGGPGAHLRRDIARLLALRGRGAASPGYARAEGLALLWLEPWDGATSLAPERLDELYLEICRRVRLVEQPDGRLVASAGSSRAPRVAPTPGGLTGDPWAPLAADGDGLKVLTVAASGFHYRRMVELIWPQQPGTAAPLQVSAGTDAPEGVVLLARALTRGQGKTEGYHERRVPLSARTKHGPVERATDATFLAAERRVRLAGEIGKVLRSALLSLFQGGPQDIDHRDKDGARKAQPFLDRLDTTIDRTFFEDLCREIEAGDAVAERRRWVRDDLLGRAETMLRAADAAAPKATRRRLRARVGAEGVLHGYARRNEHLAPYLEREPENAT
jgi:CRISPR system Cascade subunit CasA